MQPSLFMKAWPWAALLALIALRVLWLNAYPLDSDETQHAHVAWAWTQGLLPYRDVFDNHGPLFGLINAPVLELIGERADVMSWLRLAMQPWYFLALFACWRIGRRLYDGRVAFVAVLVVALYPRFFMIMGQFRTDDLWAALWVSSLAVLAGAPPRVWRGLLAGVLAGAALSVSQKTILLLATLLVASMAVWLAGRRPGAPSWRLVLAYVLGVLAVPLSFVAWFAAHGALGAAWYGLAGYNMAMTGKDDDTLSIVCFLVLAPAAIYAVLYRLRRADSPLSPWRSLLILQSLLFLLIVLFLWPLVTRQDFLPVIPPLLLGLCGWLAERRWPADAAWQKPLVVAGLLALELVLLVSGDPPWQDELKAQRDELANVLRYSDPGDTVMDAKGAAVFRDRPYYPVIESMAKLRMRHGLLPDTIAAELVRHETMLVIRRGLPDLGDAFVARNYLPVDGQVRIAGLALPGDQHLRSFDLRLPGDYTLIDGQAKVAASLDGTAPSDHWTLTRGEHHLQVTSDRPLALVWSKAWGRGWRPAVPAQTTAHSLLSSDTQPEPGDGSNSPDKAKKS